MAACVAPQAPACCQNTATTAPRAGRFRTALVSPLAPVALCSNVQLFDFVLVTLAAALLTNPWPQLFLQTFACLTVSE